MAGNIKGVVITKASPKPGAKPINESTSGLIVNGVAVTDKLQLNTTYTLYSKSDAEDLGVNMAYDTTNKVVLYHHISEFYEEAGEGVKLFLRVVSQSVSATEMVDLENAHAKTMINDAEGEIFQLAVGFNPSAGYTPVVDGIDQDALDAIPKAQGLCDWAFSKMYPVRVILEGKSYAGPASSMPDLRNLVNVIAPNVSIVIGQDLTFAGLLSEFNSYAAVGTCLGTVARAAVSENIKWVEKFNLTDAKKSRWLAAGLSDNKSVMTVQDEWQVLSDKGYIFPIKYARLHGFRWNNDHCCTPVIVDNDGNMNESQIRFGRTLDKAALAAYTALLGKVGSPQPVNPATGKVPPIVILNFKTICEKQVDRDLAGEISSRKITIDKDSNLLPPNAELKVGISVVPMGSADQISVSLKLSNKEV